MGLPHYVPLTLLTKVKLQFRYSERAAKISNILQFLFDFRDHPFKMSACLRGEGCPHGSRVKIGHHKIGVCAQIGQNRIGWWGVKKSQKTSDIIYVRSQRLAKSKLVVKIPIVGILPYFCLIVHLAGFVVHDNKAINLLTWLTMANPRSIIHDCKSKSCRVCTA